MEKVTYRTELAEDGYERIEAKIQKIENLANNGIFANESRNSRFYQIVSETKKLRQIVNEVLLLVPQVVSDNGEGSAA
jgi:hypothetical protein